MYDVQRGKPLPRETQDTDMDDVYLVLITNDGDAIPSMPKVGGSVLSQLRQAASLRPMTGSVRSGGPDPAQFQAPGLAHLVVAYLGASPPQVVCSRLPPGMFGYKPRKRLFRRY